MALLLQAHGSKQLGTNTINLPQENRLPHAPLAAAFAPPPTPSGSLLAPFFPSGL